MIVKQLFLNNFRNYQSENWQFSDGVNIFYGNNGHGKTNILESLHFSALGSSHRTSQESDLINNLSEGMSVIVDTEYLDIKKNIKIKKENRRARKEITIDKVKIKPRELIGELKITMFSPEDLQIVKNEPALRRRFLDMQISQVNSAYCLSLARYNKIIKQRNILLKQIKEKQAKESSLEVWDEQFSKEAAYLLTQRIKTVANISKLTEQLYANISGNAEKATSVYVRKENGGENDIVENPSKAVEWYKNQLMERRKKDIERANTGIGPHRDDIFFSINEMPARSFASQGQQRSLVLALKMSEIQLIKEECGEYPVLLLDDVMSELDVQRKANLLEFLSGRVQTFITLTEKEIVGDISSAVFYKVENGTVSEDSYG